MPLGSGATSNLMLSLLLSANYMYNFHSSTIYIVFAPFGADRGALGKRLTEVYGTSSLVLLITIMLLISVEYSPGAKIPLQSVFVQKSLSNTSFPNLLTTLLLIIFFLSPWRSRQTVNHYPWINVDLNLWLLLPGKLTYHMYCSKFQLLGGSSFTTVLQVKCCRHLHSTDESILLEDNSLWVSCISVHLMSRCVWWPLF